VFLDVDGVLVTTRCLVEEPSLSDPSVLYPPSFTTPLERACLVQLANLVRCSQCRIVLTSTWRNYPDMHRALQFALGEYGLLEALVGHSRNLTLRTLLPSWRIQEALEAAMARRGGGKPSALRGGRGGAKMRC
jgi:hypothetical protein